MKNASVSNQKPIIERATPGDVQEINAQVARGLTPFFERLTKVHARPLVGSNKVAKAVEVAVMALLPQRMKMPHQEVEWWNRYYFDHFQIRHSFEDIDVPVEQDFPTRIIVMHGDVSGRPQLVANVYKKHCKDQWWQYADDLDVAVPDHDRSGTYAIRVADVLEAPDGEEGGTNLSTQQALDRAWVTTTLPERLVDGDAVLLKKKVHLDRKKITLCPGSRTARGRVPSVDYSHDDRVEVGRWLLDAAPGRLRFRRAIV